MSHFPLALIREMRRGRVIPFAGAGVSRAVAYVAEPHKRIPRFPTWFELLNDAGQALEARGALPYSTVIGGLLALTPPRYLEAAQFAKEGLADDWFPFLKLKFDPPREGVAEDSLTLARLLWSIPPLVITTNYDNVLAWASDVRPAQWSVQSAHGLASYLRGDLDGCAVWHLHGHISRPQDLILTPDGYSALYPNGSSDTRFEAALAALRSVLVSHTFLFVGFSFDDQAFGDQLRWASRIFEGESGTHYMLTRRAEADHVALRLKETNIEIVTYEDHGAPLLETIRSLLRASALNVPASTSKRILHNLPRRQALPFVGRVAELAYVCAELRQSHLTLIEGTAGTGKTALALEVAHRFAEDETSGPKFDAIVWLSAKTSVLTASGVSAREASVTDLDSVFVSVAQTLVRFEILNAEPIQRAATAQALLCSVRTLVVVDNFESITDDRILQFLRELPEGCAGLITSRERLDIISVCHLREMPPGEIAAVVGSELSQRALNLTREQVQQVVENSGGLPLAAIWSIGRAALDDGVLIEPDPGEANQFVDFAFGEQLARISREAGGALAALALFPAGAEISDLLRCVPHATPEHVRELQVRSLVERQGPFLRLLPVAKRLLLPRLNDLRLDPLPNLYKLVVAAIRESTARETEIIITVGSHRSTWRTVRENVLWAMDYALTNQLADEAVSLVVSSYWPMLMNGELKLFIQQAATVLENTDPPPETIAQILLREASAFAHLEMFEDAAARLAAAEVALGTVQDPHPETRNMQNFVGAVIAIQTNNPNADDLLNAALDFERARGATWAIVGFMGWRALHLCKRESWHDAEIVCTEALELSKDHGLTRSHTFISLPLAISLRHQLNLERAAQACDAALALADEFAEMHNFAHLSYERALIARDAGDERVRLQFAAQARDLYLSLGLTSRAERAAELLGGDGVIQ